MLKWKTLLKDTNVVTDWTTYHDLYLLRFLRARKFELNPTHEMFITFLKWKKENSVDDIESWEFKNFNLFKELYPHAYHKVDKMGRPIYIELISRSNLEDVYKKFSDEEIFKYYIKEYERTLHFRLDYCSLSAKHIVEQSCTILCVKGYGITDLSGKVKSNMQLASKIGQDYYPEMLGEMYIINAGFFFSAIWAIAKAFIDAKTSKKIHVLGTDYLKDLIKTIDLENLPFELGGKCKCSHIKGGCFNADIGPWNPEGDSSKKYTSKEIIEGNKVINNS